MASTTQEKAGPIKRGREFVHDVKTETEKVTWPSQEDLKSSTSVVLVFLAILATMIGVMDIVLQNAVLWMYRIF